MIKRTSIGSAALILLVAACGSQVVQFPNDSGTDAVALVDAGHDSGLDAAKDTGHDCHMSTSSSSSSSSSMVVSSTSMVSSTSSVMSTSSVVATDAGHDSGVDAGHDSGHDSGVDTGHDSGVDTGVDSGHDSGVDAGVDSGHDSGVDTGVDSGVDAGFDSGFDAGVDSGFDAGFDAGVDSGLACNSPALGAIDLGTAGDFAILAKSGISTVPASTVTGDIGVSPVTATAITGFSLTPCSGTCPFSTSTQVVGNVYAANFGPPTPSKMTTAVLAMQTAFTSAAGQAPSSSANIELGAGDISGLTLAPGVYKWSTGLLIATDVTLQGTCNDVWVFEIAQNLTVSNGVKVVLSGGALAKNVFWQVSGNAVLGSTVQFQGIILSQTEITLDTGSSVVGRLLSQTAVTLIQDTVTKP